MEIGGWVFAVSIIALLLLGSSVAVNGAFASKDPHEISAHPPIHIKKSGTPSPTGLSPVQISHAYGFDLLSCYGTSSCGSGQTIAIVDAYDDPNIESDLAAFSTQYGLPPCTTANGCFTKATPQGLPKADTAWALEESLDVEWAHAMAPGAKILLVESQDNSFSSLLGAVDYAASQPNVHQVSMSWVANEFSGESDFDYHFNVAGVSFVASSGDNGAGVAYPAASPYVVSVGGTTLNLDGSGNVQNETAWSGSGGGVSSYEPAPSYQAGFNSNSGRGVPDVSYVADPSTGLSIYDSYGYGGWNQVGGTSIGAPQWASSIAIVNSGGGQLSSSSFGTNTALYSAATGPAYSANYRDITSGSNGNCSVCNAGQGYDYVTGVGSPLANNLIPYLEPSTPDYTLTASPQSLTINSGSSGYSVINVTSVNGFSGTVSLTSSPNSSSTLDSSSVNVPAGGWAAVTLTVTPTTSTTYTVTGGTGGSISHFVNVAVTVLTVPSAPQNLVATAGNSSVTLSWDAPLSNGGIAITGYNVYRGTTSGGEDTTPIATVTTTSYTNSGLTNGQTYYYDITAINSVGQSISSNEASATPQLPALSVSVTTDSPVYTKGSTATITVTVTSSTPVSVASVTLTVTSPNGNTSQSTGMTNSNGQVIFSYHMTKHGMYTASATAAKPGYVSGSGSTTFSK